MGLALFQLTSEMGQTLIVSRHGSITENPYTRRPYHIQNSRITFMLVTHQIVMSHMNVRQ